MGSVPESSEWENRETMEEKLDGFTKYTVF